MILVKYLEYRTNNSEPKIKQIRLFSCLLRLIHAFLFIIYYYEIETIDIQFVVTPEINGMYLLFSLLLHLSFLQRTQKIRIFLSDLNCWFLGWEN